MVFLFQQARQFHRPGPEHVVGTQDETVVEVDIGVGIESFEHQLCLRGFTLTLVTGECTPVLPCFLGHPLHLVLHAAHVRVRYLPVVHQIRIGTPGNLSLPPGAGSDFPEGPVIQHKRLPGGMPVEQQKKQSTENPFPLNRHPTHNAPLPAIIAF